VRRPARLKQGGEMDSVVAAPGVPLGQVTYRRDGHSVIEPVWQHAMTKPYLVADMRVSHLLRQSVPYIELAEALTLPSSSELQFDPVSKDIQVVGRDVLYGTAAGPVVPSSVTPGQWGNDDQNDELGPADHHDDPAPRVELRTYQLADAAGNTLSLLLKVHTTHHQLQARIVSLQYNGAAAASVARNTERFDWQVDDEHASGLSHLEQQVRLGTGKDHQLAHADFNARENVTRIAIQASGKPAVRVTKPGLALLQTNTSKGTLSITYRQTSKRRSE